MTDKPIDKMVFGPLINELKVDFQEVEEIINKMNEKDKMNEITEKVAPREPWPLPTSEACNIPIDPNGWITPQFVSPIVPTTKYVEFVAWLKGMCKAYYDMDRETIPIEDIKNKLKELEL